MKKIRNLTHGIIMSQSDNPSRRDLAIDETTDMLTKVGAVLLPLLKIDISLSSIEEIEKAATTLKNKVADLKIQALNLDGWVVADIHTVDTSGSEYSRKLYLPADRETVDAEVSDWISKNAEGPTSMVLSKIPEEASQLYPCELAMAKMQALGARFSWSYEAGVYKPMSLQITLDDSARPMKNQFGELVGSTAHDGVKIVSRETWDSTFGQSSTIEIGSMLSQCKDLVEKAGRFLPPDLLQKCRVHLGPYDNQLMVSVPGKADFEIERPLEIVFKPARDIRDLPGVSLSNSRSGISL